MKKKLFLAIGIIVLVLILAVIGVFVWNKSDSPDVPPEKEPMLQDMPAVEELLEGIDVTEPLTAGVLVDSLYGLAGSPELKSTFPGCNEKDFVTDKLSGEAYSDSFIWNAYNGVLYVSCTMSVPVDPGVVGGVFGTYLRYESDRWKNGSHGMLSGVRISMYDCATSDEDPLENYQIIDSTEITHCDAVLAMYFYAKTYLGIDLTEYDDRHNLEILEDSDYRLYVKSVVYGDEGDVFSASLGWSSSNGITERFREDYNKPITVNEYSAMLENFIEYLSNL